MAILSLHYFLIILFTTCSLTFLSKKPSSDSMSIIRSPIETFTCPLTSFGRVICYFGNTLLTSNIKRQPPYLYFKKAKLRYKKNAVWQFTQHFSCYLSRMHPKTNPFKVLFIHIRIINSETAASYLILEMSPVLVIMKRSMR
jgi:hypothetical protein